MSQTIFGYESGTARRNALTPVNPVDIQLAALSASRWRVSNKRFPTEDPRSLLGFVEDLDSHFEVMELVDGWDDFAWFAFPSLAAACAHFSGEPAIDADQKHMATL